MTNIIKNLLYYATLRGKFSQTLRRENQKKH